MMVDLPVVLFWQENLLGDEEDSKPTTSDELALSWTASSRGLPSLVEDHQELTVESHGRQSDDSETFGEKQCPEG